MARSPARFRQLDVARALKGAIDAGAEVKRLEIDLTGKIVLAFTDQPVELPALVASGNPWDEAV